MMKMLPKFNLGVLSLAVLLLMVVNAREMSPKFEDSDYVFFSYKELRVGAKMPIYFGGAFDEKYPHFLPKDKADLFPLSHQKLPYLVNYFGFEAESPQAKAMDLSLKTCEAKIHGGGAKKCVTSLESMLDFVRETFKETTSTSTSTSTTKNLLDDDDLKVLSTSPLPKKSTKLVQIYTIVEEPRRVASPKMTACHMLTYPYALYLCHYPEPENQVFEISLVGEDGTQMNAIANCHMNTKGFDPTIVAFRLFDSKPGTPVCHFLTPDGLIWVPALAPPHHVKNVASGRKYMGEYWGEKAMEALVEGRSNDGHKFTSEYWAKKAIETLNDVGKHDVFYVKEFEPKPNHVVQWHPEDHGEPRSKYFVTDFVVKPNLQC